MTYNPCLEMSFIRKGAYVRWNSYGFTICQDGKTYSFLQKGAGKNILFQQKRWKTVTDILWSPCLIESTGKKIQELYFNTAKKSLKQKHKKSEKNWKKGRKNPLKKVVR